MKLAIFEKMTAQKLNLFIEPNDNMSPGQLNRMCATSDLFYTSRLIGQAVSDYIDVVVQQVWILMKQARKCPRIPDPLLVYQNRQYLTC